MECRDAQFYLRLRRHVADELGPEVTAELDRHVVGCPRCAADARAVARFDAALATAMQNVPIPPGLRDQLIAKLSAQRGAVLRRKAYRWAAVAAVLLLSIGMGYGALRQSRPRLDTDQLVQVHDARQDPDQAEAAVRQWLVSQKLPDRLPEPFDYRLLVTYGTELVQGRDVPVVVFHAGTETAKVYFFRDSQFDLKAVPPLAQASHWQAKAYPRETPGVLVVVVSTIPTLDPFLRGHGGAQG
jgi:hypothetical protein